MGISEVVVFAMMGHMVVSDTALGTLMEFADGLNLVICNTLFTKEEAKLVTYVAGPVKSTIDYIMVRQDNKAKVRNVKVISSEECVPKHKLLVINMWFKATETWHRKFEPRVHVWKLKEEKTCEEYRSMVGDKVEEAKWKGLGVNDHWQQMKGIMMESAQDICGMTKGPRRHKKTWWNEEVAEAVREKKIKYGKWKKENMKETRMEYKKSRQNAKKVISSAKEKKQKECANDLNDSECQNEFFLMAKQTV